MTKSIAELAAASAEYEDYTKTTTGGDFEKSLPPAGICLLRFREYIELGLHKTATKAYPKKKPAVKAVWVFELKSPRHQIKYEDSDGNEKSMPHVLRINTVVSKSEKSNHIKLFKQLNYAGKAKVPAQLLGNPYKAEVIHKFENEKDEKPKWANLSKGPGEFTFSPPRTEADPLDPDAVPKEIPVPELTDPLKLFLWNMPTKETWDSLFIDGTYTIKDGDKEEEVSKNFYQNALLDALDYEGSKLQEILNGDGETLDDLPTSDSQQQDTPQDTEENGMSDSELEALLGGN